MLQGVKKNDSGPEIIHFFQLGRSVQMIAQNIFHDCVGLSKQKSSHIFVVVIQFPINRVHTLIFFNQYLRGTIRSAAKISHR